jgi:hypothetical protein
MEITGKVVDQQTGGALANVTIWEITPDGQSAEVIGYSDKSGSYDVNVYNAGSNVNFVLDGYTGTNIAASQALLSDQVLLQKEVGNSPKLSLSGVPSWLWLFLAAIGVYYIGNGKQKRK